jgi:hypothetical protein
MAELGSRVWVCMAGLVSRVWVNLDSGISCSSSCVYTYDSRLVSLLFGLYNREKKCLPAMTASRCSGKGLGSGVDGTGWNPASVQFFVIF